MVDWQNTSQGSFNLLLGIPYSLCIMHYLARLKASGKSSGWYLGTSKFSPGMVLLSITQIFSTYTKWVCYMLFYWLSIGHLEAHITILSFQKQM